MYELELSRNAALSYAETYFSRNTACAEFDTQVQARSVADNMPLFTPLVAGKMSDRIKEQVRRSTMESICGKLDNMPPKDIREKIQFAKTQKKDSFYADHCYGPDQMVTRANTQTSTIPERFN